MEKAYSLCEYKLSGLNVFNDKIEGMKSWRPSTEPLNVNDFQEIIATHQLVAIHFWAVWNLRDRDMDSMLENLRPKFSKQFAFYSFDTTPEENWVICRRLNILNVPAVICFINGQLHEKFIGLLPEKELEAKLLSWAESAKGH